MRDIQIDQVVIGSCTNGRLERSWRSAADILKRQNRWQTGVRCIVIPGHPADLSRSAWRPAGYTDFIDAGCAVSTPTCGPCLGGYMGILAEGERCVATTNRNFVGRMGHVDSEVYLASPAVGGGQRRWPGISPARSL